jgi:spore coat polysaccharide biosynthesis protein SpsF
MREAANTTAIIQARMGSTRLPGKVMAQIAGKSMIERVIERVKRANSIDRVLIATTCLPEDDVLCAWAAGSGYPFYRGSQLDVLDRYYQAAFAGRTSRIVRISSDCPLIDPSLIDKAVEIQDRTGADYVSNKLRPTFPVGEDVEVFLFKGLAQAWRDATMEYERVHVTPYFYRNPAQFHLEALAVPGDFTAHRWTVDTAEDLEFMRQVYTVTSNLDERLKWTDVLEIVKQVPHISEINSYVKQKALEEC